MDPAQVSLAVRALLKHTSLQARAKSSGRSQLLGAEDQHISLIVGLRSTPDPTGRANKPRSVALPHSLHSEEDFEVCLIVKDGCAGEVVARIEEASEASDSLEVAPLACVTKVLTLSKLRAEYSQHAQRRTLCSSYDLFLVDDRIVPLMPKALGKIFYIKKMQPIPITIARRGKIVGAPALSAAVTRHRSSTFAYVGGGSCSNVRVAKTDFSAEQICENIIAAATTTVEKFVPRRWKNVMSLHIKTQDSIALPVYNALPDAAVAALVAAQKASVEKKQEQQEKKRKSASGEDAAEESPKKKSKKSKKSKSKSNAVVAVEEKSAKKTSKKKKKTTTKKTKKGKK